MGQIFNRIKRIAKTYINDSDLHRAESVINEKDEDLKRIIEELNKEKARSESREKRERSSTGSRTSSQDENVMTTSMAYSILGLPDNSGIDQIKAAYKKMVMEYHPDRVATLGKDLRDLAAKKTLEINSAYSYLKKVKSF